MPTVIPLLGTTTSSRWSSRGVPCRENGTWEKNKKIMALLASVCRLLACEHQQAFSYSPALGENTRTVYVFARPLIGAVLRPSGTSAQQSEYPIAERRFLAWKTSTPRQIPKISGKKQWRFGLRRRLHQNHYPNPEPQVRKPNSKCLDFLAGKNGYCPPLPIPPCHLYTSQNVVIHLRKTNRLFEMKSKFL